MLRSFNVKGKFENIVLVDVDVDPPDVIIIDAPESVEEDLEPSSRSREGRRFTSPGVISIDDDSDDDRTDYKNDPEIRVECRFDLGSDAFSSKSYPAPGFVQNSACLDDDECWVIRGKQFAFKSSKCKETYIGKTSCGKRFGLRAEFEDNSSESDYSDSELMQGSVGKLREQWEKAFQIRKYNARGFNMPSAAEEENGTEQFTETYSFCDSNIQKQKTSASGSGSGNGYSADASLDGDASLDPGMRSPCVESDKKVEQESWSRFDRSTGAQFSHVKFGMKKVVKDPSSRNREQDLSHSPLNYEQYPSGLHHCRKGLNDREKLQPNEPLASILKLFEEKQGDNGETVFNRSSSVETPLGKIPVVSGFDRESVLYEEISQNDETQIRQSCIKAEEVLMVSVYNSKTCGERGILHVLGAGSTAYSGKDVIIDREKLKQTDQYKQAEEEEWASRQRELQIQAEEARRLRKRKKAEGIRLLDMEKRQKQRLEEMREKKNKDEEQMNLKEQLRLEVGKELSQLELSCSDMASLLRSLGITVNGGGSPLSKEVNAAYRRALQRFHPDRASKTDIRQQVEAEEKFKLISRMKETLLASSCH